MFTLLTVLNTVGYSCYSSYFKYHLCSICMYLDQIDDPEAKINPDAVRGFVHSVKCDINELSEQNKCMDLQHSFRPVFVDYFKVNLYHRYKAVTFRRVLSEKGYDLQSLQTIWNEKQKVNIVVARHMWKTHSIQFSLLLFVWFLFCTGWSRRYCQRFG